MASATYVHVEKDGRFGFHTANGDLLEIGPDPVRVEDAGVVAYLDSVPFVKRAGSTAKADPSGGEEA